MSAASSRLGRPPSRRGHDGRQPAWQRPYRDREQRRRRSYRPRLQSLPSAPPAREAEPGASRVLRRSRADAPAHPAPSARSPASAASRNRKTRWSGRAGRQRSDVVDGDRPRMRGEREFFDLRFEKCQVWRAVEIAGCSACGPSSAGRGSRRVVALHGGRCGTSACSCGGFDPGNQRGATRWLASDDLDPRRGSLESRREPRSELGSKRIRWCDSGTAETSDSSSARPRPGRSSSRC